MSPAVNRVQFLRGDFRGGRPPLRPPWSLPEAEFVDRCERCGDCIPACPDAILKPGCGGFPEVDFSASGCSFCGDCLTVCKGRALIGDVNNSGNAWDLAAAISPDCLSVRGIVCRACGEVCDERAIRFRLEVGGVARPLPDAERCNGCGECFAVCPVRAVRMVAETRLQQVG